MLAGCQKRRNTTRQAIETIAATTSTSHGPWKFETRNCGTAKLTPATRMAGHISFIPFQPANAQMSQKGTSREKKGSCRPIIEDRSSRSRPVTAASAMTGEPSAP